MIMLEARFVSKQSVDQIQEIMTSSAPPPPAKRFLKGARAGSFHDHRGKTAFFARETICFNLRAGSRLLP
jgi:hypothetical protein